MNKVCVVGGSGFLGSHVCDQLSEAGYHVIIYDRILSTWQKPDQTMVEADILDSSALDDAVSGCEAVYNFAAIADIDEAIDNPLETVKVNILGNAMVLEA